MKLERFWEPDLWVLDRIPSRGLAFVFWALGRTEGGVSGGPRLMRSVGSWVDQFSTLVFGAKVQSGACLPGPG